MNILLDDIKKIKQYLRIMENNYKEITLSAYDFGSLMMIIDKMEEKIRYLLPHDGKENIPELTNVIEEQLLEALEKHNGNTLATAVVLGVGESMVREWARQIPEEKLQKTIDKINKIKQTRNDSFIPESDL